MLVHNKLYVKVNIKWLNCNTCTFYNQLNDCTKLKYARDMVGGEHNYFLSRIKVSYYDCSKK